MQNMSNTSSSELDARIASYKRNLPEAYWSEADIFARLELCLSLDWAEYSDDQLRSAYQHCPVTLARTPIRTEILRRLLSSR